MTVPTFAGVCHVWFSARDAAEPFDPARTWFDDFRRITAHTKGKANLRLPTSNL